MSYVVPTPLSAAKYGWIRERPDQRDKPFIPELTTLPTHVSLRDGMPPVYDQGRAGSCTANALAAQLDYMRHKQGESFITPSRLFIYYNERAMEGTTSIDAGAMGRDGIKSLAVQGVCPESEWQYDISKLTIRPVKKCYIDALKFESLEYRRVDHTNLTAIKTALAQGLPISMGFTVYESFESDEVARTGIMPLPRLDEQVMGGHEVLLCGYDDDRQLAEIRNSWGPDFGDSGHVWMPYSYLTSRLCSDFWTVTKVK